MAVWRAARRVAAVVGHLCSNNNKWLQARSMVRQLQNSGQVIPFFVVAPVSSTPFRGRALTFCWMHRLIFMIKIMFPRKLTFFPRTGFQPEFSHWRCQNQEKSSYSIALSISTKNKFDSCCLDSQSLQSYNDLWIILGQILNKHIITLQGLRFKTNVINQTCFLLKSMIRPKFEQTHYNFAGIEIQDKRH